jgi:hypothetical protein
MSLGLESETVATLLRIALTRQHYDFKSVCFFAPIDGEAGVLHVLFPPPGGLPLLNAQQEHQLLSGSLTNHDPRNWKFDEVRGRFFQGPPDEVPSA